MQLTKERKIFLKFMKNLGRVAASFVGMKKGVGSEEVCQLCAVVRTGTRRSWGLLVHYQLGISSAVTCQCS